MRKKDKEFSRLDGKIGRGSIVKKHDIFCFIIRSLFAVTTVTKPPAETFFSEASACSPAGPAVSVCSAGAAAVSGTPRSGAACRGAAPGAAPCRFFLLRRRLLLLPCSDAAAFFSSCILYATLPCFPKLNGRSRPACSCIVTGSAAYSDSRNCRPLLPAMAFSGSTDLFPIRSS